MTKGTHKMPFRRRREQKTDYRKRLAMVKSGSVRLVIRTSNKRITAQAIKYDPKGDITIANADSRELAKYSFYGTNNTPSAYLTGLLLGKRMPANEKAGILDIGLKTPSHGSVVFAALKGIADAGVRVAFDEKAAPSEDRITGKVLDEYAKGQGNENAFSGYRKAGINPGEIAQAFAKAKAEIEKIKGEAKKAPAKKGPVEPQKGEDGASSGHEETGQVKE